MSRLFPVDGRKQLMGEKNALIALCCLLAAFAGYLTATASSQLDWTVPEALGNSLLLLLCVLPFIVALYRGRVDIFEPIYMLSVVFLIAFLLPSLLFILSDYVSSTGLSYRIGLSKALFIACVGLLGGYLGYIWGRSLGSSLISTGSKSNSRSTNNIRETNIFYLAVAVLVITAVLFSAWVVVGRVPLAYLNALNEDVSYTLAGRSVTTNIVYFWMFRLAWPLLILLALRYAPNHFWRALIGSAWVLNLIVYTLAGNRGTLFILLGASAVAYYLRRKTRPSATSCFLALALVAFISSYLLSARGFGARSPVNYERIKADAIGEITDRGALRSLIDVAYVFPGRADFVGFDALSDAIYAPVPRVLWPNKPSLRAVQDISGKYVLRGKVSAIPAVGIYYAGFGVVGAFAIVFVYGVLSGIIYEFWLNTQDLPFSQVLLAGWLPFTWVLINRGALSLVIVQSVYIFGPVLSVWLCTGWIYKRTERL
jgi:oligosaccharide repeat unit polymerase